MIFLICRAYPKLEGLTEFIHNVNAIELVGGDNRILIPKLLWPIFCFFLKFEQAILVRVLMLNFETSCTKRPLHNQHKNVFCRKKSFIEKRL